MGQLFPRSFNALARFTILGGVFIVLFLVWILSVMSRSPYATKVDVVEEQPVPFSHQHHVQALGIDCRYCHTTVETSAFAGMPPTKTCMNCHSMIWSDSPMLEPVRKSFRDNTPIRWNRVHDLPDFVYFDHSIHVKKGVACATCHGQVDQMPLMRRKSSLHMEWCLKCHKDPEKFVRPKEEVFNMDWHPPVNSAKARKKLAKEYDLKKMTNCTTCHR